MGSENGNVAPSVRPEGVGILGMEVYFPATFVEQADLEAHDGVSAGKYTIGLGQDRMAFCNDREDIHSICLTVFDRLLSKYNVSPAEVGRLEVGTETIIDKSKSVKSVLMRVLRREGNHDVEGIDTTNACYGGTNALFNCVNWVESSAWDGRYAVCVCGDIAVYAKGNARPTGGCGAVAMLVGPNAPLVLESAIRASYMDDAYDFYKPDLTSEYPTVDGQLSMQCYFKALDHCYRGFCAKLATKTGEQLSQASVDFLCMHSPFNKLVQKSFGRLLLNDALRDASSDAAKKLAEFGPLSEEASYANRDLDKFLVQASKGRYDTACRPSTFAARLCGNMYTASLYGSLISLIDQATMFSLRVAGSLASIREKISLSARLESRTKCTPEEFERALELREQLHGKCGVTPQGDTKHMEKGTYFLVEIDDKFRRTYECALDREALIADSEKIIDRFEKLLDEPFEPVTEANGVRSYRRESFSSSICMVKGVGEVPCNPEHAADMIENVERRREWDKLIKKGELIEKLDDKHKVRDFVVLAGKRQRPDGSVIVAGQSVEAADFYPHKKNVVRAFIKLSGYLFEPLSENLCRVTYILQIDLCGNVPLMITNKINSEQPQCIHALAKLIAVENSK